MVAMEEPEHLVWVAGAAIAFGIGFTEILLPLSDPVSAGLLLTTRIL